MTMIRNNHEAPPGYHCDECGGTLVYGPPVNSNDALPCADLECTGILVDTRDREEEADGETAGGARFNVGKPQYHSLPLLGLQEVARVGTFGAEKYGHYNWWKGQSFSTLVNSAMRHTIAAAWAPTSRDAESGLLHAAHAVWNWLALLHFISEDREVVLDDITSRLT